MIGMGAGSQSKISSCHVNPHVKHVYAMRQNVHKYNLKNILRSFADFKNNTKVHTRNTKTQLILYSSCPNYLIVHVYDIHMCV